MITPPPRADTPDTAAAAVTIPLGQFSGDPATIGAEHGRRFHGQIDELFNEYLMARLTGSLRIRARLAAASFELFMPADYRAEVAALAQAAGMNVYDALLGQCYLDLLPVTACSTIALPASASPDGVARMGRNLDFDSGGILDKHSVLIVYHPAGKYAFAAIGWPGMIGVLSGMNQYGLCLANMEVDRPVRAPSAMPYMLLYRSVLEKCRTVDEAIALLQNTPRQSANNLMLMDAAGDRAVAEIRPEAVTVRRGEPASGLISTNHQRGRDTETRGRCWRYDLLHASSSRLFGRIDRRALQGMLQKVVQGSGGTMTLQSMVFEPSSRVIYLATGLDAPSREFQRIDLKAYFPQ